MLRYVYERDKPKGAERMMAPLQAKEVWESLIYLNLKCPEVDVTAALAQVEKSMGGAKQLE